MALSAHAKVGALLICTPGPSFLWIFCTATLYLHIFEHGKIAIIFTEKFIGLASAYCIAANQEE